MAKLSAHGRTEIWRVAKGSTKFALMSDGKILKTLGFGWKVAKIKEGLTPEQCFDMLIASGYQKVSR